MFQRIRTYQVTEMGGQQYRPRAYGDPRLDGSWDGWLVFFPIAGGPAIASDRETTQSTFEALTRWAAALTPVYLEGALARALDIELQPSVIGQLNAAEYEALEDAERFETIAGIERAAADADESAAAEARGDAERIRRERLATERSVVAK